MNYKKLIVSSDNKLVLEDYNLTNSNSEILDLNKSLNDVTTDEELQTFIKENAIDSNKIYLVCLKEDFGTNDQRIENIPNVKKLYKVIKKVFKKFPNIFFFIYNTFMKNESAISPSLETPSSMDVQNAEVVDESNEIQNEFSIDEMETSNEIENNFDNQEIVENESFSEETTIEENIIDESQQNVEVVQTVVSEEFYEDPSKIDSSNNGTDDEDFFDDVINQEEIIEEEIINIHAPNSVEAPTEEVEIIAAPVENNEDNANNVQEVEIETKPVEEVSVVEEELVITEELTEKEEVKEVEEIEEVVVKEETTNEYDARDVELNVDPVNTNQSDDWSKLENTNEVFKDTILESSQLSSPYDEDVERFNELNLSTDANNEIQNTEIEIPESYFNEEEDEQISYEDYHEFQNDYELNVHALKSIYDFIWRMLVLNNYNLKLNDLLYLSVNNLDAFSIGQSDFVRQTANKAESLFDLILQLDIKLEFNNSLFYIYLAELFSIKSNRIIVNNDFLNTISIWINKSSKDKFVSQVEQFINYSTIYNKKIIFAYFIELANFIKGCIPTITPSINLLDIHRILNNPLKSVRENNVFGFMVRKMNEVFYNNGVSIESEIIETPENMFSDSKGNYLSDDEINWKTKLSHLYKRLLENIRNYVLSKGNNEGEIFNIYLDIKDLRMYKNMNLENSNNSTVAIDAINNGGNYLTIGDAFNRANSIVPTQVENIPPFMHSAEEPLYQTPTYYTDPAISSNYNDNMQVQHHNTYVDPSTLSQPSRPTTRFNSSELEDSMTRRIEEYERKIKENIARIEAERKNLREKMEVLKNL